MRLFYKKIFILIAMPLFIGLSVIIYWDPFKVFLNHEDYYTYNYITGNREDICLKLFEKLKDHRKMNSFIIGNSRSQAFKVHDWKNILAMEGKTDIRGFHFDGSALGLFNARNILRFLDENTDSIKNILMVFDEAMFDEISNPTGPLYMEPPQISGESFFNFYLPFVRSSLDPMFILSNIDFRLTKKHKPYMGKYLMHPKYFMVSDNFSGDLYYGHDREIKDDSVGYYMARKEVFYERKPDIKESMKKIRTVQLEMLTQIKQICDKNKTNIKIVIAPIYDQVPINAADKRILVNMFGNNNVFDYSGKNHFTESISNYYEDSHFRPVVARQIMKEIYLN